MEQRPRRRSLPSTQTQGLFCLASPQPESHSRWPEPAQASPRPQAPRLLQWVCGVSASTRGTHTAASFARGAVWNHSHVCTEPLSSATNKACSGLCTQPPQLWLPENRERCCCQRQPWQRPLATTPGTADLCVTSCCTPQPSSPRSHRACSVCTCCPGHCAPVAPAHSRSSGLCAVLSSSLDRCCPLGLPHNLPWRNYQDLQASELKCQLLRQAVQ